MLSELLDIKRLRKPFKTRKNALNNNFFLVSKKRIKADYWKTNGCMKWGNHFIKGELNAFPAKDINRKICKDEDSSAKCANVNTVKNNSDVNIQNCTNKESPFYFEVPQENRQISTIQGVINAWSESSWSLYDDNDYSGLSICIIF